MVSHPRVTAAADGVGETLLCSALSKLGAVAIGRNEGERLRTCLESLSEAALIVYVDSGSTDDSIEFARNQGVEIVVLDTSIPFTAARARNEGFRRLKELSPDLRYVLFADADCELLEGWMKASVAFLDLNPEVAAVCGRLRERYPERSVYNWLCDREWDGPIGEIEACGGIFVISAAAFKAVHGFRADLIAGEESDLCIRIRRNKLKIWRLDAEMALHDSAMTRFSQWLRRSIRSGYAFANGAHLHGSEPERHWLWESRRAMVWGLYLPLCLFGLMTMTPWAALGWLLYPAQFVRQTLRSTGTPRRRATLAFFQLLGRFPRSWGQIRFLIDRLLHRKARIIEHK